MGLARAWRRRLYASVGLTVVAPAALLVSLALLAAGGGSFSLGSLKQVFSGPSAPASQPVTLGAAGPVVAGRQGARRSAMTTLLTAALGPGAARSTAGSGSGAGHHNGGTSGGGGTGGGGGSPGGGGPGGGGPGGGGGGPGGGGPGGGGPGGGGPGGGGGGTPHHGHPTVADKVVNAVTPVTSTLPAPAGPIVTGVVKSAGKVADKVLHKPPLK
jgi:hypothetical protein